MTKCARAITFEPASDLARPLCRLCAANGARAGRRKRPWPGTSAQKIGSGPLSAAHKTWCRRLAMRVRKLRELRKPRVRCTPWVRQQKCGRDCCRHDCADCRRRFSESPQTVAQIECARGSFLSGRSAFAAVRSREDPMCRRIGKFGPARRGPTSTLKNCLLTSARNAMSWICRHSEERSAMCSSFQLPSRLPSAGRDPGLARGTQCSTARTGPRSLASDLTRRGPRAPPAR
jgi:hypothetical protein